MKSLLKRLVREDEGQDLIEYALLAALIALACTLAMKAVGDQLNTVWDGIKAKLVAPA
jgi:pilus assembly protein Flp/PilA